VYYILRFYDSTVLGFRDVRTARLWWRGVWRGTFGTCCGDASARLRTYGQWTMGTSVKNPKKL